MIKMFLLIDFSCPECHRDLEPLHIKHQLICNLLNEQIQTDIPAKANQLTSLEDINKYAEAY